MNLNGRVREEVAAGRGSIDEMLVSIGPEISPEKAMRRLRSDRNVRPGQDASVYIWRGRRALLVEALHRALYGYNYGNRNERRRKTPCPAQESS